MERADRELYEITGDERCLRASAEKEQFLRQNVEGRFWYTGAHPDLPPGDFEQDSIYAIVEYWLDKHDRTGSGKPWWSSAWQLKCAVRLTWVRLPCGGFCGCAWRRTSRCSC